MSFKFFLFYLIGLVYYLIFFIPEVYALNIATPFSYGEKWIAGGIGAQSPYCGWSGSYYGNGFHTGKDYYAIDFNGMFLGCTKVAEDDGKPILAIADGTISFAGGDSQVGYGYNIVLNHGDGYTSRYAHLRDNPNNLSFGQKILKGQRIGFNGTTGSSQSPHLHFVLYKDGISIKPSPMDGQTLQDHESGKIITSYNVGMNNLTTLTAPALYTPKKYEMLNKANLIKFSWQDVRYAGSGDLYYRLHIFLPDQSSAVYSSAWNKNWINFEKGFSSWNGTNHLRFAVQVKNSKNQILQSEVRHFYLNFPPNIPTNIAPANNAQVNETFTFSWKDGGDLDNYPDSTRNFGVRIYKNNLLFRTSVYRTNQNWTVAMDPGTYQWQVCADDGGFTVCSSKRTVVVQ